jgi:cyclopropane-fatty-acyl-phospholipid synthase
MVYSPGYFASPDTSLEEAQIAKFERICRRLQLRPGERLLEIGCGWGGLICHAAQHYGVSAYGVTLSQEQFDYTQAKIDRLGLSHRIKIELLDYRSIRASEEFDAVVQIGMFEHVGIDNHDAFFSLVHRVLRPRGAVLARCYNPTANPRPAQISQANGLREDHLPVHLSRGASSTISA